MENNENFDIKSFASPDASHAPVYIWVWNDICTHEIIDAQLNEMQMLGIRAFYILPEPKEFRPDSMPTNLTPDYLSEEFFELCAYAVEKGKSLGMQCWIYDEGGWPSGGACGKVLKAHPEYARQVLKFEDRCFHTDDVYVKSKPCVLAAFLQDDEMIEEGYVFSEDTVVTEYVTEKQICGDSDYPDLLNKKATEFFIEITHEKYASSMKNALGKNVTAVFTDEPKAPFKTFNSELAELYEAVYGESVLPHLPLIAQKTNVTEENIHILYRWYDLCSRMFCENFLRPCKEWANKHNMAFIGHLDKDHSPSGCVHGGGNFNLMRALRCFDIPGIDVIWRQLYPESITKCKDDMNAYNGFFPRYASSAAAQNGTKLAMAEIFGVAGPGLIYDTMRFTVGYLSVRGINIFNLFNFPLGRKGPLIAQELPVFTKNQLYYRYLGQFNRYIERLSYISSVGERICETGLYYPVCDFQGGLNADDAAKTFDGLGRTLEDTVTDFDIVDDDIIQTAKITSDGCMQIGNAKYKHIIIPESAYVPRDTQTILNKFINAGGNVSHGISNPASVIKIEGTGLRATHRKAENADLYCFFREAGESGDYRIYLPSSSGYLLDAENGKLRYFKTENGILSLCLAIGETAIVLLTDEILKSESTKEYSEKIDITNNFLFRKESELTCDENGFKSIEHADETIPVCLGDWSYLIGSAYSGSGVYETSFTLPCEKVGKDGEIDLGDVHFSACVYLNDKPLGTALMPPYRFKIPEGILGKTNKLKVIVTNTSANWYVHTDYFKRWNIKELSPYFDAEMSYAKDFVSGGLYGPVTLYTE